MNFELELLAVSGVLDTPVLTRSQREALYRVWRRDTSVAKNYLAFRRDVMYGLGMDSFIVVPWKGMMLTIEQDGYTHS